jgi:hypothetical protein
MIDPNATVGDNPIASVEPPKSSKKFWLFGGCGCLLILLLICGGVGGFAYYVGQPLVAIMTETTGFIQTSQVVGDKIGSPVSTGAPAQTQDPNDPGLVRLNIPVDGPNGSGIVVAEIRFDTANWTWNREALYLEFDGETFDMDPDAELNLEIDDAGL